ncbi:MAG TPA: ISNCY family transposase [Anaerolineae bacterium]|nr:ISNCY family transposase [Anaerolineae bacterium]
MDNIKVTMTIKEIKRVEVMILVETGKITGSQAATMMGTSLRQTRRIIKKYREGGAVNLAHGNRGKPSPNRLDPTLTSTIKQLLKEKYTDYNTLHLTEILAERHALRVSASSLTRIRQEAGYPTLHHKKSRKYYTRRERKPMQGEMLQADGSIHDWLEGRGPKLTLIAYIDDATNKVYATFREQEDAAGYLEVLQEICLTEGIPQSIYMDKRLTSRKRVSLVEQLAGKEPKSQFERVLEELGIELIPAHSPQAKGRIERLFETLQDRLVKALREASADSLEKANGVLKRFLHNYNQRFMVKAQQDG